MGRERNLRSRLSTLEAKHPPKPPPDEEPGRWIVELDRRDPEARPHVDALLEWLDARETEPTLEDWFADDVIFEHLCWLDSRWRGGLGNFLATGFENT